MPNMDTPTSVDSVNRLIDELTAATDGAQLIFIDSEFYDPAVLSGKAEDVIRDSSRPVKRYASPRLMVESSTDSTMYGNSYVITGGSPGTVTKLSSGQAWTFEKLFRQRDRITIQSGTNVFSFTDSVASPAGIVDGYHGCGIFSTGAVEVPVTVLDGSDNEMEYFRASGFIYLSQDASPQTIAGPYGTTTCTYVASPAGYQVKHVFSDSIEVTSTVTGIGDRWVQFYIWMESSDTTTDFRFLLGNTAAGTRSVTPGIGAMTNPGYLSFTGCFIDEVTAEASASLGSPPYLTDDSEIITGTTTSLSGDGALYDMARERYLLTDTSTNTMTDPDTGDEISVGAGAGLSTWTGIVRCGSKTIATSLTTSGVVSLGYDSVSVDTSSISSPIDAAAEYRDGTVLAWVSADGKFYETSDGVSWTESDVPAISGATVYSLRIGADNNVWALCSEGSPVAGEVYVYDGSSWASCGVTASYGIASGHCRSALEVVGSTAVVIADAVDGSADPGTTVYVWDASTDAFVESKPATATAYHTLFYDGRFAYVSFVDSGDTYVYYYDGWGWSFECVLESETDPDSIAIAAHRRVGRWTR